MTVNDAYSLILSLQCAIEQAEDDNIQITELTNAGPETMKARALLGLALADAYLDTRADTFASYGLASRHFLSDDIEIRDLTAKLAKRANTLVDVGFTVNRAVNALDDFLKENQ